MTHVIDPQCLVDTPPTSTHDAAEALALLERAVAERGADYVYSEHYPTDQTAGKCLYVVAGRPACLVGLAMSYVADITGLARDANGDNNYDCAEQIAPRFGFDAEAARLLGIAQEVQDATLSWGEALEAAREFLGTGKTRGHLGTEE